MYINIVFFNHALSHLLGHEADGSLLSYLKMRGWANGLSSYASKCFQEMATSGVSIDLTDEGVAHVEEILEHLFTYIGILVKSGPILWIAEEVKTEADNAFRYEFIVNECLVGATSKTSILQIQAEERSCGLRPCGS